MTYSISEMSIFLTSDGRALEECSIDNYIIFST